MSFDCSRICFSDGALLSLAMVVNAGASWVTRKNLILLFSGLRLARRISIVQKSPREQGMAAIIILLADEHCRHMSTRTTMVRRQKVREYYRFIITLTLDMLITV